MVEHSASVTVKAPVHQVYELFTHFNDFPKFMRFVKEVTYYDDQRSHWVVQMLGRHEWDAVNEDWIPDKQVGWRSVRGLKNGGRVKFRALSPQSTEVAVYIYYVPPTGTLGRLGENLGVNSYIDTVLQTELTHIARMVEEAPEGALDPMSSHYLFHKESVVSRGEMTERQRLSMQHDPMMTTQALAEREQRIAREKDRKQRELQQASEVTRLRLEREKQAREAFLKSLEEARQEKLQAMANVIADEPLENYAPHPVYDTLGGRHAGLERTNFGDKDSLRPRYPWYTQDPMMSRLPPKEKNPEQKSVEDLYEESPWMMLIRGNRDVCILSDYYEPGSSANPPQ
ncbi:hypothetical protein KSC_054750 [Ktedonobacter sp. SOSP1-52]|uniref:SRPBCC family protein n=1 Tax=Ktedonobacter sp. SOSP1-52 TaxID=2778366 RepID=UPI0019150EDD|nr:SRPBCC family protein [Ktedonobacter sp. SOSP1-52]GHO66583.1 hypothetical protein KSC_054750 [Ktedonobacter sp. SOSP1-52]